MEAIDGKRIAKKILGRLGSLPHPDRFLAIVTVKPDTATESFVRAKEKVARELGVEVRVLTAGADTVSVAARIGELSRNPLCGGVVVQLPLPAEVDRATVLAELVREKDVDVIGLESSSFGVFSPSVIAVREVLEDCVGVTGPELDGWLLGKIVAVLGSRGFLVGAPVVSWFTGRAREVIALDLGDGLDRISEADVIVSGVGVPNLIGFQNLKPGAIVIDFGYGTKGEKTSGDFEVPTESRNPELKDFSYTPTPGGTGPVLVAALFENFYKLNL